MKCTQNNGGKRPGRKAVGGVIRDVQINIQTTAQCAKWFRSLASAKGGLGAALEALHTDSKNP